MGAPRRDPFGLAKHFPPGTIMSECLTRYVASATPRESALPSPQSAAAGWRTPAVVIVCGCLIAAVAFGPRSALGFFLTPLSSANHWGRDVFAFALAVQNLLWGMAQPVAGAIADRFGAIRVLCAGAVLYTLGLVLMAHSTSAAMLDLSAGVLIGFGLSGTTFPIVLAAFGKILPAEWRSTAFGLGTAAGSFGQFLFSPLAVFLMDLLGWQNALVAFGVVILVVLPASLALASPSSAGTSPAASQSLREALGEALGHRSYVLLMLGFFTCGFQLASSPCTCRLISPIAACHPTSAAGRWRRSGCSTSSVPSAPAGSASACPNAICCRFCI